MNIRKDTTDIKGKNLRGEQHTKKKRREIFFLQIYIYRFLNGRVPAALSECSIPPEWEMVGRVVVLSSWAPKGEKKGGPPFHSLYSLLCVALRNFPSSRVMYT